MTTDNLSIANKDIELATEFLARAVDTTRLVFRLDEAAITVVIADVLSAFRDASGRPAQETTGLQGLPQRAPELWRERDLNRRENPSVFLRRVYHEWIGNGLTRHKIKELDPDLYRAVSVWFTRHPEDSLIAKLKRKSDIMDEMIARLTAHLPAEDLRKLGAALYSRERRAQMRKTPATSKASNAPA